MTTQRANRGPLAVLLLLGAVASLGACASGAPDDHDFGGAGLFSDDGGSDSAEDASDGGTDGADTLPMDDDAGSDGDTGSDPGADTDTDDPLPPSEPDVPVPPDGPPGHGDPADLPENHALLDEIEGWATGTTGGLAGTLFVVETLADSGPHSLREGLQSPDPHWIVFAEGVNGTIDLDSPLLVGSNKTVDARGHAIRVRSKAGTTFTGFRINSQTNVVLTNLNIDDGISDWDQDSEGADGITILNSDHVWIHHCTIARWVDGAIDIRFDPSMPGELPHHISVTYSHINRVYQALNWTADRVSFGHNYCDRARRRCIQMVEGRGISYNNVIDDWSDRSVQHSLSGAQLYSLRNMFIPDGYHQINKRTDGGKILNSNNHAFGTIDYVDGSDSISETFKTNSKMNANVVNCDDDDGGCWSNLRDDTIAQAGVQ